MNPLNMAVGSSNAPRGSRPEDTHEPAEQLPARIKAALIHLQEAFHYARDLDADPWEFAIELGSLRRLQLSNSDLRWLAGRGLVEHGVEVTLGGDATRSFQHPSRLLFSKRTCFVLSAAGAELTAGYSPSTAELTVAAEPRKGATKPSLTIATPRRAQLPKWDRDRRELRVGKSLVKRYKIPSDDEESLLAALEEANWPPRIDDPLSHDGNPSPRERLLETIEALNRNQKRPLIRFSGDGAGRGVQWEFSSESDISAD